MNLKIKLKVGDEVYVVAGPYKGTVGKVILIAPKDKKALVAGVNIKTHHQKADKAGAGGLIKKEAPIDLSNLALLDPKLKVPTKVGYKFDVNGKKVRFAKKSGEILLENKE
jgi:large subunit ribosomal protein L24